MYRSLKSSLVVVHELLSDGYGFQNLSLWFAILQHAAICKAVYAAPNAVTSAFVSLSLKKNTPSVYK